MAIASAENDAFSLSDTGDIIWQSAAIARMHFSDGETKTTPLAYLTPTARLLADEMLNGDTRQRRGACHPVVARQGWRHAKASFDLQKATDLDGLARGVAFQLLENKGNLARADIADLLVRLDQPLRRSLRQYGVRFGAYNVFMPALLKPAPAAILALATILEEGREAAKTYTVCQHRGSLLCPAKTCPRASIAPPVFTRHARAPFVWICLSVSTISSALC